MTPHAGVIGHTRGVTKPPRLIRSAVVDLPVVEASGLAARSVDGVLRVLVVGDRAAEVAVGAYVDGGFSEWSMVDVGAVGGRSLFDGDSQLEAIAVDGGSLVAMMSEEPPVVFVADTQARQLRATITLTAPAGSPLHGEWDDSSSRGEGLVLLRGGRLLVAKEKRPRALVEFGPVGSAGRGLSRDDFLAPDEPWEAPHGAVDYVSTAMWRLRGDAKRALGDISALGVGRDRSLWLLSDKSRCLARLPLDEPLAPSSDEIRELAEVWRLPKGTDKPEGVVGLDDDRLLVAMDTSSTTGNGIILELPDLID